MSAGWASRRNGIALVRASRSFGSPNDRGEQCGVGRARADAVDLDLVSRHLAGHRLGERDDAALGRGIDRPAGGADPAGVRAQVHHRAVPLCGHDRQDGLAGVEHSVQVDGDRPGPSRPGRTRRRGWPCPSRRCSPGRRCGRTVRRRGRPSPRSTRAMVTSARIAIAAPPMRRRRVLAPHASSTSVTTTSRPLGGEFPGDRLADALAGAGHDRDLAVEPAHSVPPRRRHRTESIVTGAAPAQMRREGDDGESRARGHGREPGRRPTGRPGQPTGPGVRLAVDDRLLQPEQPGPGGGVRRRLRDVDSRHERDPVVRSFTAGPRLGCGRRPGDGRAAASCSAWAAAPAG